MLKRRVALRHVEPATLADTRLVDFAQLRSLAPADMAETV